MKPLALLMVLLIIATLAYAQGPGGPAFSDSELDSLVAQQQQNFAIIKKCQATSFVPPDPEGRVTKIDVHGLDGSFCKVTLHTIEGDATYLLPESVYATISSVKDLTKGECSGACEYTESTMGAPPTDDPQEQCIRDCVVRDCDLAELVCQKQNRERCEGECGIEKAPDMSEMDGEQRCIFECVNRVDPSVICGSSQTGETGNAICQMCAEQCVHLYAGPCLSDEELTARERACKVCEHCYGEPVIGDSGEGYECIVDVVCGDASGEFGDDPGTGPDSFEPGHEPGADNVYWWDYDSTLEVSGTGGKMVIENKQGAPQIEVSISTAAGTSLEQRGEKIVIKNQETEIEVDNNIGSLMISEDGTKREIENIEVKIEEDKPIFEFEEKAKVRLLGVIPMDQTTRKKVDAEKMHLLREDKPWWSVLAVKPEGPDNCGDGICGSLTHVETAFTCPADCAN